MPTPVPALDFLAAKPGEVAARVIVAFGDEPYLVRLVRERLRVQVLGEDGALGETVFEGRTAQWRDVLDELSTLSLFGSGPRLVVVSEADEFVTRHRPALEQYLDKPKSSGVLVLEPATWPANTRLAKGVAERHLAIECKTPPPARLGKWLVARAREAHQAKLSAGAAEELLEIVGPELGRLDQELAKLAGAAGSTGTIDEALVRELVGGWRTQTAWVMLDAALDGRTGEALEQLDRLLTSGENEVALLAQLAASLRRLAAATRLIGDAERAGRRPNLRAALEEVGVKSFVLGKSEAQLKQLGRTRAGRIYRTLVEADQALKGASRLPPRLVLERLIARWAPAADPRARRPATGARR